MDEKEYHSTYQTINPNRCVFEKAINSRVCNCKNSIRFNLADREGVSCNSKEARTRCEHLLNSLRKNARFTLQLTMTEDKLPHNAEIKIQNGGLKGIASLLEANDATEHDICTLIDIALLQYRSIDSFPYQQIVRSIAQFQSRRRRKTDY